MNTPFAPLDDLLDLPFFTAQDRQFVDNLRGRLKSAPKFPVEFGANKEIRAWVNRFGEWDLLPSILGRPLEGIALLRVVLAREVLASHAVLADLAFVMQFLGGLPLLSGASAPVKAAFEAIRKGEKVAAFALSEPDAGTDLSGIRTSARKVGDAYIIKGEKHLISNVGAADYYALFARLEGGGAEGKLASFLLPADAPGLEEEDMPGMIPHPLGRLRLNAVELPADHLIGAEGQGMKIALGTLGFCRPSVGGAACGMARRSLEAAIAQICAREAFGGTLADLPLVKAQMSQSIVELDAARLLVYRCAWQRDQAPTQRHDRAASTAKWQATELAQKIIDRSLQLCGGVASLEGSIQAELYRAIRPLRIYEGASEIHQMLVFDALRREGE